MNKSNKYIKKPLKPDARNPYAFFDKMKYEVKYRERNNFIQRLQLKKFILYWSYSIPINVAGHQSTNRRKSLQEQFTISKAIVKPQYEWNAISSIVYRKPNNSNSTSNVTISINFGIHISYIFSLLLTFVLHSQNTWWYFVIYYIACESRANKRKKSMK